MQVEKHAWLGRQDSNLRMPVPKTGALPLGDAPAGAPHVRESGRLYPSEPALEASWLGSLTLRAGGETHGESAKVRCMAEPRIRDFHAHIYFDPPELEGAQALAAA